ncbi:MAG: 23S rRNA (adenine(2503)-C(2))-methyltransferase RlmN [Thermoanaerobaculia bacterium]|nr:23S rRNA (adenine(2503)-C(2))-methyltransferase RlmN [Thermoanaerobaculia bacterium]
MSLSPSPGESEPNGGRSERRSLLGLPRPELERAVAPLVDRTFRARQIYDALYRRGVSRFADMTDLSLELRGALEDRFEVAPPRAVLRERSADGSSKALLELADGATIEAVAIPDGRRMTLCLSSQAGCGLACRFCVTGFWGAGRNLDSGEIVGQALALREGVKPPFEGLNLVFMGMGEPLQNLDEVARSLEIFSEFISWRRITVSTAGVIPGIERMASWERRPNLAVSLHAPDDERRGRLMPINRTYPLDDLLAALKAYPLERGRKVTIEYLLVRDFNDAPGDADLLVERLAGLDCKVNLIPVNPDPVLGARMVPPDPRVSESFRARLKQRGCLATLRRRRGDDVSAACGQLRAPGRPPRGFRHSRWLAGVERG